VGASHGLDDDKLTKRRPHPLRQDTRKSVRRPARRERHDPAPRSLRASWSISAASRRALGVSRSRADPGNVLEIGSGAAATGEGPRNGTPKSLSLPCLM
jgi:hypothetical protein